MDFNELKNRKTLNVSSNRIAETLITNCGIDELLEIKYKANEDKTKKAKKIYVFRNSAILFQIFAHFAYNENYKTKGENSI